MKHEDIQNLMFVRHEETGAYVSLPRDAAEITNIKPAACISVDADGLELVAFVRTFETLLASAPMLYQQMTQLHDGLDALGRICEGLEAGNPVFASIVKMSDRMKDGIILAQQVAQNGVVKTVKLMDQEARTKPT